MNKFKTILQINIDVVGTYTKVEQIIFFYKNK